MPSTLWPFYLSEYLIQSVVYAALIAIIVEALLRVWCIRLPSLVLGFRLLVLLLPPVTIPLYYLLSPWRSGPHFRANIALFDLRHWLGQPQAPTLLWYALIVLMFMTTAFFITQELIPLLRQRLSRQGDHRLASRRDSRTT
ncbi:MAG: hypothetical protein M1136_03050 [Chloroflexi bacterium]|nr:hypothetical protein [Chloroflexota bacterium]